jgi:hypothetical protein
MAIWIPPYCKPYGPGGMTWFRNNPCERPAYLSVKLPRGGSSNNAALRIVHGDMDWAAYTGSPPSNAGECGTKGSFGKCFRGGYSYLGVQLVFDPWAGSMPSSRTFTVYARNGQSSLIVTSVRWRNSTGLVSPPVCDSLNEYYSDSTAIYRSFTGLTPISGSNCATGTWSAQFEITVYDDGTISNT